MFYYIKRKISQIKNLFSWLPIIWNQYDFDYSSSINVFRFQLLKIANFLESEKSHTQDAKNNAKRIRTVIKLMDKVYNEEYGHEYIDKMKAIYGDDILEFDFEKKNSGSSILRYKYETTKTKEEAKEIREMKHKLFVESQEKQNKAHRILWKLIDHNIQNWWD